MSNSTPPDPARLIAELRTHSVLPEADARMKTRALLCRAAAELAAQVERERRLAEIAHQALDEISNEPEISDAMYQRLRNAATNSLLGEDDARIALRRSEDTK